MACLFLKKLSDLNNVSFFLNSNSFKRQGSGPVLVKEKMKKINQLKLTNLVFELDKNEIFKIHFNKILKE